jgi:hypothetical protein
MNMRPQMPTTVGPTRHDPNRGRGYGGRSYFAGRGRVKAVGDATVLAGAVGASWTQASKCGLTGIVK